MLWLVGVVGIPPLTHAAQSGQAGQAVRGGQTIRVTGIVRDETNAIPLPGVPVEVVGTDQVVYTDVDGRYLLQLGPGTYQMRVALDGYQERTITLDAQGQRTLTLDIGLTMAGFAETVRVEGRLENVSTSSAEAQLIERRQAPVITDNIGSQEMRANGDSDAAAALTRVTGLSLVDSQYVFVRGLGERYSNTTLGGAVIPTTEPDKKVVPLDLFPSGLIDNVQVAKSYTPDKSAEFAGGLVQITPMKLPVQPVVDFSYGFSRYSTATGKNIPLSPLGRRDWLGYDKGVRALPSGFPADKIVRRGIFTPDVGYSAQEITEFGRLLENRWRPEEARGRPGQNWSAVLGNRFADRLGILASITHSYRENFVEEDRRFYRIEDDNTLEAVSDYRMRTGTQRAQLGVVANLAYQFTTNHRVAVENFYTHSGRDEGRLFTGSNEDNDRLYRNYRVQFIEEGLISSSVSGDHFLQRLGNSRIDWRASVARASRDEPDLREVLYEAPRNVANPTFVLADESQSGFRMFNTLDDDTKDLGVNWSVFNLAGGRPTQFKFGVSYIERARDFASRRFRFIPISTGSGNSAVSPATLQSMPEQIYTPQNIGTLFRFNEETRPTDAYTGDQTTTSGYGMIDIALAASTRLVGGARVERFDQTVDTFDPFGLFLRTIRSEIRKTDVFPGLNIVQALRPDMNLRFGYSITVNRPEFRELAPFEFTDVIGNRAVRGNASLERALIQNLDGRWEMFTGVRGVMAASVFYKRFGQPIERVVVGGATPLATFQNSDSARNFGFELEAGQPIGRHLFLSTNYTFVDSKISLLPEQRTVQTSLERPLAGQSRHLFNIMGEVMVGGFSARLLYNFFGDRISDVGANEAPDIIEEGRGMLDLVLAQRVRGLNLRLSFDNLTDSDFEFTQAGAPAPQRIYRQGRTVSLSLGVNVF